MANSNTLKSQILNYFTAFGTRTAREAERNIVTMNGDTFTHKGITSRVSELVREGKLVKLEKNNKYRDAAATRPEYQYRVAA